MLHGDVRVQVKVLLFVVWYYIHILNTNFYMFNVLDLFMLLTSMVIDDSIV